MEQTTKRVAWVTGASRGIGRAITLKLAETGFAVVASARSNNASEVVDKINVDGGKAVALSLDVTDSESIPNVAKTVMGQFGRIDVLVNNAGIVRDQLLMRMKPEDWDTVIATNLTAVYGCCQSVLRPMMKQRSGRIINISSVVGQSGNPGQTNYSASKAGLIGFSKSLAREVASRGITVNVVAPGMIDTDMTAGLDERAREALSAQIPMARLGVPDEVASVVCFLASHEASYITGQVVAVNGGLYM
jgi:3-oxoacyl-[acyl-carrier protein] reductase|tara:strand:- start:483 stop:1223 length:741 start_codon:yes stop_codon:yes gene_type:complete